MAILSGVSPLYGAQGIIGGLLFRTVGGQTIVSSHNAGPKKRRRTSALQQATRNRFAEASRYAKGALRDATMRMYYTQLAKTLNVTSAYTAAITDFMRYGADTARKSAQAVLGKNKTASSLVTENTGVKGLPLERHVLCKPLYNKANGSTLHYKAVSPSCSFSVHTRDTHTAPLYASWPVVPT